VESKAFARLLCDAADVIRKKNQYYVFRYKYDEDKIPFKKIRYFESRGRKVYIHLLDGRIEQCRAKLSAVESNLAAARIPFLRIHQSYLVNFQLIKSRSRTHVVMVDGTILPISAGKLGDFNKRYGKLLGEDAGV
jgi:DNA-binding LytR/AlgR family response regulator